jgi:hypothetical protein
MRDESGHGACVDTWIARAGEGLGAAELAELLENALSALWRRTFATLGEITLIAIAERVLYDASAMFPPLASLKVESDGFHCEALRGRLDDVDPSAVRSWMRFVLVELLTVLGNLTAEILTPLLHAELSSVAGPGRASKETQS